MCVFMLGSQGPILMFIHCFLSSGWLVPFQVLQLEAIAKPWLFHDRAGVGLGGGAGWGVPSFSLPPPLPQGFNPLVSRLS